MDFSPSRRRMSPTGPLVSAVSVLLIRTLWLQMTLVIKLVNRRYWFSFLTISVITAKFAHISAHAQALSMAQMVPWSYSFFFQDFALLLVVRFLLGDESVCLEKRRSCIKLFKKALVALLVVYSGALSVLSVSFSIATGSQVHWRNAAFAGGDAASRALMLSGARYFVITMAVFAVGGWLLQDIVFKLAGLALQVLVRPVVWLLRREQPSRWTDATCDKHIDAAQVEDEEVMFECGSSKLSSAPKAQYSQFSKIIIVVVFGFLAFCRIFRPASSATTYLSWTIPLLPIIELTGSEPTLDAISGHPSEGMNRLDQAPSALSEPISLSWLPRDGKSRPGFEDWYEKDRLHYRASLDPLKIDNLQSPLLPELQSMLSAVSIRHIMVIKLESTRKDLFPVKKDGLIWNRFKDSYDNKSIPHAAVERLRTLTPVARYLTGDYDDEFDNLNRNQKKRGGINFSDAYTSCTYTLKSLTSSLCGINALAVDFNQEWEHHPYQPCLPQILDTFNELDKPVEGDYRTYDWKSYFMQSVTLNFDKFDRLVPKLGFPAERTFDRDYLQSSKAKFGKVDLPDVNYFGFVEAPLADYMHDAFQDAMQKNGRAFITHVTSTSHHPYGIPEEEPYVPLGDGLEDMSKYVNAIGYDDRWLGEILDILDKEGVANETLVIFAGDHGISIPENDKLASYSNPSVGCNHIPLVFSHPHLPPITIHNAVTNIQILPTLLDILIETSSLAPTSSRAAKDLLRNYEGQSMIRPLRTSTQNSNVKTADPSPHPDWQFTIINPGSSMVGVRDSTHRSWRLVVPVINNQEWQFSDIGEDPREQHTVREFEFTEFIAKVSSVKGKEAARWAEEAAFAARYFVEENHKRWRFGPYSDTEK